MDIRELNRRAVHASMELVAKATAEDLGRPTPCAGWTLADLLAHMIAQHRGFAAAAQGAGADPEAWQVPPVGDDAVSVYTTAAEHVLAAFAEDGVLDREFALPEFGRGLTFPATTAIGFHFIDYLVHSWDVAQSLGVAFTAEPALVEAAWPIAQAVPDDERRRRPGAAFQPSVTAPEEATRFDQILALLGRSPS
ncbi:TIGR03086 family metal-binding protein [Streptosporangium sp. NPDC000396]|uniref:TIGR03086 family metal-binding protein n=1 Tax=Streptosporangium sp. NPDC000396 TaxID=3366185 RepID=UPI0036815E33